MHVVCGVCGQHNPPERQFCTACNSYLDADSVRVDDSPEEIEADEPTVESVESHSDAPTRRDVSPSSDPAVRQPGTPQQPDAPSERVAPSPARRTASDVATVACPRCQTTNRAGLRFCRKCGQILSGPVQTSEQPLPVVAPPVRPSWWDRLTGSWSSGASREARAAYRQGLPRRYRLFRWGAAGLVVAVVAGLLLWRGTPFDWAKGVFYDLTNKTTAVDPHSVTAAALPSRPQDPDHPPANAIDGEPTTFWATAWSPAIERAVTTSPPACGQVPAGSQSLVLHLPSAVPLRGITVIPGLTDPKVRGLHWTPKSLQVLEAPGRCKTLTLQNTGTSQTFGLDSVTTDTVTVTVVDANPPPRGQVDRTTALTEVTLLRRPS